MPESLSTFPPFPSRPGLVGAATSGREPRRQPCPLPAAFPGKRGRTGAGSRGNLALPRAPSSLALPWGPPRPGGEEKRPPRGGAARGEQLGPTTSGAVAARTSGAVPAHPSAAAAGGSRGRGAAPGRQGKPSERGRGKAEEEAARERR